MAGACCRLSLWNFKKASAVSYGTANQNHSRGTPAFRKVPRNHGKEGVAVLRQLPFPNPGDAEHGLAAVRLSRRHFPQGTVMEYHIRRHLRGFRQPAAFRAQELEQRIVHIHTLRRPVTFRSVSAGARFHDPQGTEWGAPQRPPPGFGNTQIWIFFTFHGNQPLTD